MNNVEELNGALDYPWDKWTIFLHPEQRELVERDFNGPARVSGSAGTGKTSSRCIGLSISHAQSGITHTAHNLFGYACERFAD